MLGVWARVVLVPVAVIGAALSFRSLYAAAVPIFGSYLSAGFPALVDLLILGSCLQYVAGAKAGRPMGGWRLTAHAGVAATLALNALAAARVGEVPWHVVAPAVWAVLVELTARQVLADFKASHHQRLDRISAALWITAPVESARTRLLMLRTGISDAHTARIAVGVHAAARESLRLALPDRHAARVRRIINRQLRAGTLPPAAILTPLGWTAPGTPLPDRKPEPETVLPAILKAVLDTSTRTRPLPNLPAQNHNSPEPPGVSAHWAADPRAAQHHGEGCGGEVRTAGTIARDETERLAEDRGVSAVAKEADELGRARR
jgi:hypothetical protein